MTPLLFPSEDVCRWKYGTEICTNKLRGNIKTTKFIGTRRTIPNGAPTTWQRACLQNIQGGPALGDGLFSKGTAEVIVRRTTPDELFEQKNYCIFILQKFEEPRREVFDSKLGSGAARDLIIFLELCVEINTKLSKMNCDGGLTAAKGSSICCTERFTRIYGSAHRRLRFIWEKAPMRIHLFFHLHFTKPLWLLELVDLLLSVWHLELQKLAFDRLFFIEIRSRSNCIGRTIKVCCTRKNFTFSANEQHYPSGNLFLHTHRNSSNTVLEAQNRGGLWETDTSWDTSRNDTGFV